MADRYPLIVNSVTKKIEELSSGDRLDLSGNGIIISGDSGSGKYLTSNGSLVFWSSPGDVYLTQIQTVTNKTFETCIISGAVNTLSNIPNTALINSGITINGTSISLGGSVTTPDNNTTYSISAQDGTAGKKIIRLTSGGNAGAGVDDDVTLVAGSNVTLSRTGDEITIASSYVDTNTITRLQSATGGTLVSGDVTIGVAGNAATISQTGNTITITANYVDTVTRVRGTTSGTYNSGDITIAAGNSNVTVTQPSGGNTINISSVDTITKAKVNSELDTNAVTGIVNFVQSGATTISRSTNTITISSTDTNTVTSLKANSEADAGAQTGILNFTGTGATTVTRSGTTFTINSTDNNTTYTAAATGGLTLSTTAFSIKNSGNITGNKVVKWDSTNNQLSNSIITDDGSTVTVAGNLTVTGTTTTVDSTTILVADNEIEMRKGNSIVGSNGGIRLNRTTNSTGVVQTYTSLQWLESGGYWRVYDGSVGLRLVTETEIQTLTNKTLTSPILTTPTLGAASATTINGLTITGTIGGVLTIANAKTATVNNTLAFSGTDGSSVAFGNGGTVAYTELSLGSFASTSSTALRTVITDEVGSGSLVFNTGPTFSGSIGLISTETGIDVFNTQALTINFGGAATSIIMGSSASGTTRVRHALQVDGNVTLGDAVTDTVTVSGVAQFNKDFTVQAISVGRGGSNVLGNTRVGDNALNANTSGSQNTMFGYQTGQAILIGAANTAIGYQALQALSTGQNNVAVGKSAISSATTGANKNVAVGNHALAQLTNNGYNVAIGHYAGNGATGSGNVLIGPADSESSTDATFQPPTAGGDRQLVIGSGPGTWVRGDSGYNVTVPKDLAVGGNLSISGNLTVTGAVTTFDTVRLRVDDKNIELGDVQGTTFNASFNNNTNILLNVSSTANVIPGMVITTATTGITIPANTTVSTVVAGQITLSNNITSTGNLNANFTVAGPSDSSADGGGITLKGTTDKTFNWVSSTTSWTSSENLDLALSKTYKINGATVLSGTTLGSGITASSLTSVGTLTALTITGNLTVDTNTLFVDATNNRVGINTTTPGTGISLDVLGGEIRAGRIDASSEGGQISYCRSTDNTTAWYQDVYGSTANPIFRTVDVTNSAVRTNIDSSGNFTINSGNLVIGTAGKGIDFSATANSSGTMTSELLADYEEGTWTPVLRGATTAGTTTANGFGRYTKIGNTVFIGVRFTNVTISGGSGQIIISGLPFVPNNTNSITPVANTQVYNVTMNTGVMYSFYASNSGGVNALYGLVSRSGTTWADWDYSNWTTAGIYLNLSVTYDV